MLFDLSRYFLGTIFLFFGLNGFFHFRPLPKMNDQMTKFNEALNNTKIILPVVKIFEITFGLGLLLNRWTLLSTVALTPICFFIVLAHLSFNRPKGLVMAGLIGSANLCLIWHHWLQLNFLLQP